MGMKMRHRLYYFCALAVASVSVLCVGSPKAQAQSAVYFLAAGPRISQPQNTPYAAEYESFVVPVSDPNQIATIRSFISKADYPVVNVRIKAGGDGINRDFYAPGAPAWNWSVVALLSVQGEPFIPPQSPPEERYGSASMIAADPNGWIARHGDQLAEQWFPLTTEVNPFKTPVPPDPELPVMANLSTRAFTGNGQDILVGGTSISGNRPKQVAVRCSSGNLLGPYGIGTAVGFPRIRMFGSDGKQLAIVSSQRSYEIAARFPALNYRGAGNGGDTLAIVTLYPGQYTFHAFDDNGSNSRTGVVLFELYDLSLAPKPFP
jgi:hypothetical protein